MTVVTHRYLYVTAGDPLLGLPEDQAVHHGYRALRRLLPERGSGGRGSLTTPLRHYRDQDVLGHVHVPSVARSQAHFPRR